MSKKIAELTCPECKKAVEIPFEVADPPTLEQISASLQEALKGNLTVDQVQQVITEQLEGLKPPADDHRHKTADEFFDCPECITWVEKTAQRYQVSVKEPPSPEPEDKEPEPEPEPATAVGSIFKSEKEGD